MYATSPPRVRNGGGGGGGGGREDGGTGHSFIKKILEG